MGSRRIVAVLATIVCTVGTTIPAGADTAPNDGSDSSPATVELLFVQNADKGRLTPVKGKKDTYNLTLQGIAPRVTTFTDRPLRVASSVDVTDFLDNWNGGDFESDPPNAALVLTHGKTNRDTFIVELADPSYDRSTATLTYEVTLITGKPAGRLAELADDVDEDPPASFGRASLFIDALPVQQMTVVVSNIPPGGLGGFIIEGYTDLFSTRVTQGAVSQLFGAANGVVIVASDTEQGTTTVELEIYYCVPPGVTTAPVSGGTASDVTLAFDLGNGVQTIKSGESIDVPASFQLQNCGT